jgi:hypothetical protein
MKLFYYNINIYIIYYIMSYIYQFGIDKSRNFIDYYTNGNVCLKNTFDGYPPNMAPNCPLEYYPIYSDSYSDDIYIYINIINHIMDLLVKISNNYITYPVLRSTGDNVIDTWCLHRYLRYKLTYDIIKYIHPIFLDMLNAQSLEDMKQIYNHFCEMIIHFTFII